MFEITAPSSYPSSSPSTTPYRATPAARSIDPLDWLRTSLSQSEPIAPVANEPTETKPLPKPLQAAQALVPGGLPPGGAATLMGGGWAVTFASDPEADASALARLPYKSQVVAAVGGTTAMTPSTDLLRHSPEGDAALAAYLQIGSARQSLTEGVDAQFKPVPARIDLLD